MLEPNGPLPPEVYRRRRVAAAVVAVVVVVLIVWIVASLRGGGDSDSATAATTSEVTDAPETTDASETSGASESSTTSESSESSTTDEESTTTTTTGAAAAQCSDQSLAIKATPDQPQYRVGDEPSFTIAITNIGTAACERELGAGMQQALVYSLDGRTRLWSNVDCFPDAESAVQVLEPGGQARFTVKWSGKTSDPGCTTVRNQVQPGAYTLVAQLGELRSTPEPFNFV